jgi:hypothetical protein
LGTSYKAGDITHGDVDFWFTDLMHRFASAMRPHVYEFMSTRDLDIAPKIKQALETALAQEGSVELTLIDTPTPLDDPTSWAAFIKEHEHDTSPQAQEAVRRVKGYQTSRTEISRERNSTTKPAASPPPDPNPKA